MSERLDVLNRDVFVENLVQLPYSVKLTIVLHPVFSAIIPAGN